MRTVVITGRSELIYQSEPYSGMVLVRIVNSSFTTAWIDDSPAKVGQGLPLGPRNFVEWLLPEGGTLYATHSIEDMQGDFPSNLSLQVMELQG